MTTPRSYPIGRRDKPRRGMQGQTFNDVLDRHNAPESPLCQVEIVMELGAVSTPHVHREVDVYVHVKTCGPQGALTLWGEHLEYVEWTFVDQTLWIPHGIPHVAIYPHLSDAPTLRALETRTTSDSQHDVVPLPELWPDVARQVLALQLGRTIDVSIELRAALAQLGE